ncbi:hypothetical protein [Halopiger thermotolerans]
MSREDASDSAALSWLRATDWFWMIVGGFYLLGYLFWYVPALSGLPATLRDPPERFPWHWPLDFLVTALAATVLLRLGFGRATRLAAVTGADTRDPGTEGARPTSDRPER